MSSDESAFSHFRDLSPASHSAEAGARFGSLDIKKTLKKKTKKNYQKRGTARGRIRQVPFQGFESSEGIPNRAYTLFQYRRARWSAPLQLVAIFLIVSLFKHWTANGRYTGVGGHPPGGDLRKDFADSIYDGYADWSSVPGSHSRDGPFSYEYGTPGTRFKRESSEQGVGQDWSDGPAAARLSLSPNKPSASSTNQITPPEILGIFPRVTRTDRSSPRRVATRAASDPFAAAAILPPNFPVISGIRAEIDRMHVDEDLVNVVPASKTAHYRLFGHNLSNATYIGFTTQPDDRDTNCDLKNRILVVQLFALSSSVGLVSVQLPQLTDGANLYYICIATQLETGSVWSHWIHQGQESWMTIRSEGPLMPIYAQVIIVILLLTLSGLFSGLNLGLMALDKNELQVIASCGTDTEKRYAKAIAPVRKRGNYLLCSLLLGNVLVNSTLTILLDDMSSGLLAVIISTFGIVIFGEIIPQAICSRHGLAVGAKTVFITYIFMIATFPMSYPISKLLDKILGEEIGNVYDRERLMEYIRVTRQYNQLETDEVNIIYGALRLKQIKVSEIMTRLEDVFMLPHDAILDFDTMNLIQSHGFSRIPIYERERCNIIALLFMKDLAFVDPDDSIPVANIIGFYKHPLVKVFEDATLDIALNEFKRGLSHMAFIQRVVDDGERDPHYQVIGVVTLEDVIEEVLQAEIIDETDVLTDNRMKKRRKDAQVRQDFSDFGMLVNPNAANRDGNGGTHVVSPQLALAAYQYLATSVYPFEKGFISENTLRKLMSKEIYFQCKVDIPENAVTHRNFDRYDESKYMLYMAGEPADYFIMILEGRVRVLVGNENLMFESGPFSYFGCAALTLHKEKKADYLAAQKDTNTAAKDRKVSSVSRADSAATFTVARHHPSIAPSIGGGAFMPHIPATPIHSDLTSPVSQYMGGLPPLRTPCESRKESTVITSPTNVPTSASINPLPVLGQLNLISKQSIPTQSVSGLPLPHPNLAAANPDLFKPDYSVQCIETTTYLKISRHIYLQAYCASMMERKQTLASIEDEVLRREINAALGTPSHLSNPAAGGLGGSGGLDPTTGQQQLSQNASSNILSSRSGRNTPAGGGSPVKVRRSPSNMQSSVKSNGRTQHTDSLGSLTGSLNVGGGDRGGAAVSKVSSLVTAAAHPNTIPVLNQNSTTETTFSTNQEPDTPDTVDSLVIPPPAPPPLPPQMNQVAKLSSTSSTHVSSHQQPTTTVTTTTSNPNDNNSFL